MKKIPPSDMLEVQAKVAALTALSRQRKDWGVSRAWERDYLANVSPEKRCSALRGRAYKKRSGGAPHSHKTGLVFSRDVPLSKMPDNRR